MIIQKSLILFLGGIILRVARLHDALHSRSDGGLRSSLRRSQRRLLELSGARHHFLGRLSSHGRRRLLPRLQSHPQSNHSILQLQRRPFFYLYCLSAQFVYSARNPGQAAAAAAPIVVFLGIFGISFAAFPLSKTLTTAVMQALSCAAAGAFIVNRVIHKQLGHLLSSEAAKQRDEDEKRSQNLGLGFLKEVAGPTGAQLEIVYGVFGYMQVLSACFMSFAHGGNDVSNAIGPLAAALGILNGGGGGAVVIPNDVLMWGGFGIVAGLMMWGYRVIATIGKKITELTPTRGFAAEFAAASVVVGASKLGLPISATHTLVGAVMGVGFARGFNSVRSETVREIVGSWLVTIPVGALLSIVYTWIATKLLLLVF